MNNRFYIYAILDTRKPGVYKYGDYEFPFEPFYVGRGTKNRSQNHFSEKILEDGSYKSRLINKIHKETSSLPLVVKLYESITFEESCHLEIVVIKSIGRRNIKTGPLVNMNDGGRGAGKNQIQSEETRRKRSKTLTGIKRSELTKKRISESKSGKTIKKRTTPISEEERQRRSDVQKGKKASFKTKRKMSESKSGKKHSKERCNAISKGCKRFYLSLTDIERKELNAHHVGKKRPEKTGILISNAKRGIPLSIDSKVSKQRKLILSSIYLLVEKGVSFNQENFDRNKKKGGTSKFINLHKYCSPDELSSLVQKAYSTIKN